MRSHAAAVPSKDGLKLSNRRAVLYRTSACGQNQPTRSSWCNTRIDDPMHIMEKWIEVEE
jgi:hypothetical protein